MIGRLGEQLRAAVETIDRDDPVNDEERAEHARLVREQKHREQQSLVDPQMTLEGQTNA